MKGFRLLVFREQRGIVHICLYLDFFFCFVFLLLLDEVYPVSVVSLLDFWRSLCWELGVLTFGSSWCFFSFLGFVGFGLG